MLSDLCVLRKFLGLSLYLLLDNEGPTTYLHY